MKEYLIKKLNELNDIKTSKLEIIRLENICKKSKIEKNDLIIELKQLKKQQLDNEEKLEKYDKKIKNIEDLNNLKIGDLNTEKEKLEQKIINLNQIKTNIQKAYE